MSRELPEPGSLTPVPQPHPEEPSKGDRLVIPVALLMGEARGLCGKNGRAPGGYNIHQKERAPTRADREKVSTTVSADKQALYACPETTALNNELIKEGEFL